MGKHKPRYLYDHGLPFRQDLKDDVIIPMMKNLKRVPSILIIDGTAGTGKTTLAVEIADMINEHYGQPPVNLNPKENLQLAFGGKDLVHKTEQCAEAGFKVIIFDEADYDKRNWASSFNKQLSGFFREYRSLSILIIVLIQNVAWIDNRIWELGAVRGLIHLYDPEENYTCYQVYDLENCSYLLYRMDKMGIYSRRKAYSFSHGYQNGEFLPLPPERQKLMDILSDSQKKKSRAEKKKKLS